MYVEIPVFKDELEVNNEDDSKKSTRTFVKSEYSDLE